MKQVLFLGVFVAFALTGVYTIITLYDSNLKPGRMYQTPVIRPHEEPELVMDKRTISAGKSETLIREALAQEIAKNKGSVAWAGSVQALPAQGEKEYKAFCSHCHGPNLDGLGTVGQSFFPLPTSLIAEQTVKMSDDELFFFISYGGKKAPALASSMSVESRNAVIQYIRFKQKSAQ